jgi:hypothetical protein
MSEFTNYLLNVKNKLDVKSNLQFGFKIGVSPAAIDGFMKGRMTPGDEVCERIAELSGDKPEFVITLAHKSKAKGHLKKHWEKILKAVTAASFVLLITLLSSSLIIPNLYIMSNH